MRKSGTSDRPVSVVSASVRYTLVYCIKTAEYIINLSSRPGSPIILFFELIRRHIIPRGSPQRGR